MPPTELSEADLERAQVPGPFSTWQEIEPFALTFDGCAHFGKRLDELASDHLQADTVPTTLEELRGCLFLMQRSWRHLGRAPDARAMRYARRLVEGIREALSAR